MYGRIASSLKADSFSLSKVLIYLSMPISPIDTSNETNNPPFINDINQSIGDSLTNNEGCLLNHDMGLGKTIQIVALLWAAYRKTGYDSIDGASQQRRRDLARLQLKYGKDRVESEYRGMTMVVTKSSIIKQWKGELSKWGGFDVVEWPARQVRE